MTRSLKIYNTGDSPRSLKKITIFNWSGLAFWGSNEHYDQVRNQPELSSPGIYFLVSPHDQGFFKLYVGETDNFTNRLKSHIDKKDWWTQFIVFLGNDNNLNKAHVKYLEKEFFLKARNSLQINIMNSSEPSGSRISEEDVHDLKIFEDNILFILETLGLSYFTQKKTLNFEEKDKHLNYHLKLWSKKDSLAQMVRKEDEFIVLKGSHINLTASDSFKDKSKGYYEKWLELTNKNDVVEKISNEVGLLKQDLYFSSASAAASFVRAKSQNGLVEWKNVTTSKCINEENE
jgi:hypothetical protein